MKRLVVLTVLSLGVWLAPAGGQQVTPPSASYVPGEIIVKFTRGVSSARRSALMAARSSTIMRRFNELDLDHVGLPAGRTVASALAELRANPEIEFAQPNYVYQAVVAPGPPNDPRWLDDSLWGLNKIAARETWQAFGGGNGSVIVADIDTGIMYSHPDLAANMWRNPGEIAGNGIDDDLNGYADDVFGIDTVNHDSDPMDDHGHGTHTSGTIAGVGNNGIGVVGVNWNAKILSCKFINVAGTGSDAGAIECFNYIIALNNRGQNIRVSSNSWGGYRQGGISQALKNAVDAAGNVGVLNVFAAGNDGRNIDVIPFDPASFPSSSVVSVAASDQSDNRAGFSNYGVTNVDLAAPGVSILSTMTGGNYGLGSGTSMAAPHVAGLAALLSSLDPTLSVDNLKVLLMQNADVLPQWAGLVASGGRLNAFRSASVAVPAAPSAQVTFVGTDSSTQGNWPNGYGSDGYSLAGDTTSLPIDATLVLSGQSNWTWAEATNDARALRRAVNPGRVAATWYSSGSFEINLNIAGTESRRIALYCVDFDTTTRVQRIDIVDVSTAAVLDSRTVSGFNGGQYLTWDIRGPVSIRVTRLGGANAVVSGLFFGAADISGQPPAVSLTSPAPGATFALGALVPLTADASDQDGTVTSVTFYANGQPLATDTASPFAFNWTTAPPGNHAITAIAVDDDQHTTTSAAVTITVGAPTGASAIFAGFDSTTQGEWPDRYGAEGFSIVGDATTLPAYASVVPAGQGNWTWSALTTEMRALRRANGSGRIAATWYSASQFDINIGIGDGQSHQVALYCLDYDTAVRTQRIDVFDTASNVLLDSRTVDSFSGGQYLVWTVSGNIRMRVTRLAGANAVVSAVFLGGLPTGNQPPTVSLISPSPGATVPVGTPVSLVANANDADGTVSNVAFYANGQLLAIDTSSPFSFAWMNAPVGTHTLTAVATDDDQQATTSGPVSITVAAAGGASVVFGGFDTTTQGNWTTLYGSSGYSLVSDATSLPAYATLTPTGNNTWTWANPTSDQRALLRANGTGRLAATWYNAVSFDIAIGLSDGQPHQIALYVLDYDSDGRSQRVDLFDAGNNALLDTRAVSDFAGGQYLVWTVTGSIRLRLTRLSGANAVVSGVFFGGVSPGNQPPAISPSTITLRGDLVGTIGPGGNATSPIAAGPHLLLLKQLGSLSRWDGATAQEILTRASAPTEVDPVGDEAILNVAANAAGTSVFVMFTSSVAPAAIPTYTSPRPANAWQVLCRYDFNGNALSNPQAIVALQVNMYGHTGGGMVVLDDGTLLFATGDNGDAGEDGRQYAQDVTNHLSKVLRINSSTSAVTVLAAGVRNVQRLFVNPNGGDPRLEFADLGGAIAEEFNSVRLADLLVGPVENFGWGRNAGDNLAREGTFYIDPTGAATGAAPTPEAGFLQPLAQFGREGAQLVGVTGTVSSAVSFTNVTALFGDLPSGNVLAVIGAPGTPGQAVYRVNLVDSNLGPVTLAGLAGGRPDPRFFQFPDGTAGVLLERTGAFYRLTQISQ